MGDSRGAECPASLIPPTRWRTALNEPPSLSAVLLITFTLPEQLRELAWQHQRTLYGLLL